MPVVDSEGILLGIVTVDDVMDVAREEATEDFHKVATVEYEALVGPYLIAPVFLVLFLGYLGCEVLKHISF